MSCLGLTLPTAPLQWRHGYAMDVAAPGCKRNTTAPRMPCAAFCQYLFLDANLFVLCCETVQFQRQRRGYKEMGLAKGGGRADAYSVDGAVVSPAFGRRALAESGPDREGRFIGVERRCSAGEITGMAACRFRTAWFDVLAPALADVFLGRKLCACRASGRSGGGRFRLP